MRIRVVEVVNYVLIRSFTPEDSCEVPDPVKWPRSWKGHDSNKFQCTQDEVRVDMSKRCRLLFTEKGTICVSHVIF